MKKRTLTVAALTLAGLLTTGAAAATVQSISARQRPDISVVVNGVTQSVIADANGKRVYPLSYDDTVYLPIRALGDVLNHDAVWNADSQTISLTLRERPRGFTNLDGANTAMTALEKEVAALVSADTYEGRAQQYAAYDTKLALFDDDLDLIEDKAERDFQLDLITREDYSALNTGVEKLEVRLKAARTALAAKTINLAGGQVEKPADGSYADRIAKLSKRVETEVKNVYNFKPTQNENSNKQSFRQLEAKLDALERELDALDDEVERAYKGGKLTAQQYRALDLSLDQLDDRLDAASDRLEDVLGYNRDDDDWDDDKDGDRDDD